MILKMLLVQHVATEGPGILGRALRQRGWEVDCRVMDEEGAIVPESLHGYRALLVLGGPMGAYEEERYPYLLALEELIREGVERSLPVLGICLGGQLIARSFGAAVVPNGAKEIGWYPLFLTASGRGMSLFSGLPNSFPVFEWHGDTFSLPQGAVLLAEGETCRHQAFLYRECALALQFHPEVTPRMVRFWTEEASEELFAFGGPGASQKLWRETMWQWRQSRKQSWKFVENLCYFLEGRELSCASL